MANLVRICFCTGSSLFTPIIYICLYRKLYRTRQQRKTHLLVAVEVIDGLSTSQKSHSVKGRYYFGHIFNAYRPQVNNFYNDSDSNQPFECSLKTGQQSHLTTHLPNLTCGFHLSPLHPAHWQTCRAS